MITRVVWVPTRVCLVMVVLCPPVVLMVHSTLRGRPHQMQTLYYPGGGCIGVVGGVCIGVVSASTSGGCA